MLPAIFETAQEFKKIVFENPDRLYLLILPAICFLFWAIIVGLRLILRPKKTRGSNYPVIGTLKFWLPVIILLAMAIMAYAKPFLSDGKVVVKRGNAEIIFVVDLSSSMFLKDAGWSRIDIVGREISKLLPLEIIKEGDKTALFILGSTGVLRYPPASDLSLFANEVSRIGLPKNLLSNAIYWDSNPSTSFTELYLFLDRWDAFLEFGPRYPPEGWRPKSKKNRLVILFTDGDFFNYAEPVAQEKIGDDRRRLDVALAELKKRDVKIYPIGVGTRSGADLLDILKDYEREKEYDIKLEEDLKGQHSRLNVGNLSHVKDATNGAGPFLIESGGGDASDFIRASIDKHRSTTIEPAPGKGKKELWLQFLLVGISIFALGIHLTRF
jgi:hypothetical protein